MSPAANPQKKKKTGKIRCGFCSGFIANFKVFKKYDFSQTFYSAYYVCVNAPLAVLVGDINMQSSDLSYNTLQYYCAVHRRIQSDGGQKDPLFWSTGPLRTHFACTTIRAGERLVLPDDCSPCSKPSDV